MRYAIKGTAEGEPVEAVLIGQTAPVPAGFDFAFQLPVNKSLDDYVLAPGGRALRPKTPADEVANRNKRFNDLLRDYVVNATLDDNVVALIINEFIKDIAALRGETNAAYAQDLLTRLLK